MESEGERSVHSHGATDRRRRRSTRSRSASTEAPAAPRTKGQSRGTTHSDKEADGRCLLQSEASSFFSEAPTAHRGSRRRRSRQESSSKRSSSRTSLKPVEADTTAAAIPIYTADFLSKSEPTKDKDRRKSVLGNDAARDLTVQEAAPKVSPSGPADIRDQPVPSAATAASMGVDAGPVVTSQVQPTDASMSGKDGQAPVPLLRARRLIRRWRLFKGRFKDGDRETRPTSAAGSFTHIGFRDDGQANESGNPGSSFFPLNVNFITEIPFEEKRCLFGAAMFVSALLLSLAVAGMVVLLYTKRKASPLDCLTAECAAARDYLRQLLNTSKDACRDFYGYVCDSWQRQGRHGGSFRRDSVVASLVAINKSLLRHVDHRGTNVHTVGSNAIRIMSQVYRKCHTYVSSHSTNPSFEATLDAARDILNWATVRSASDFRKLVTLLVQTSLLVGIHTILAIEMFSRNGSPILYFSRRSSLLRKLSTDGDQAELSAALQLIVNGRIEDLYMIFAVDELVEQSLHPSGEQGQDEIEVIDSLKELLKNLLPDVNTGDWIVAVNRLRTATENIVQPSDMGVGYGIPSVRQAFTDINDQGGVTAATVYLAAHLDADVLSLELSKVRATDDEEKSAQFCLEMAQNCLGHLWPPLFSQLLQIEESARLLRDILGELKRASHELDLFTWLTDVIRGTAEANLDNVALRIVSGVGWAEGMNASDILDEADYAPLLAELDKPSGSAHFVQMYIKVVLRYHELRLRKPPILEQRVLLRLEQRADLAYSARLHAVVVPTMYQRAPYLYATTGVPTHFNYGTLGALIATGIADAIAPTAALLTGKLVDQNRLAAHVWWSGKALRRYNASAACLQRLHSRLGLRRPAGRRLELQWRAMFLRALGLRLAYDGLLASFGRHSHTQEFRELWPEAQAEFFARFCLLSCDANQLSDPVLSPRASCLLPLHNMHEFGVVFDCTTREDFVTDHCPL